MEFMVFYLALCAKVATIILGWTLFIFLIYAMAS